MDSAKDQAFSPSQTTVFQRIAGMMGIVGARGGREGSGPCRRKSVMNIISPSHVARRADLVAAGALLVSALLNILLA